MRAIFSSSGDEPSSSPCGPMEGVSTASSAPLLSASNTFEMLPETVEVTTRIGQGDWSMICRVASHAVDARHDHVHEDQIGPVATGQRDRLGAASGRPGHLVTSDRPQSRGGGPRMPAACR